MQGSDDSRGSGERGSENSDRDNRGRDGDNERDRPTRMFVIEKATGQVKLVVNGVVTATVLDLASELRVRARTARHRVASALSAEAIRLSVLDLSHRRSAGGSLPS